MVAALSTGEADPALELNMTLDFTLCSRIESGSPAVDFYINDLTAFRERLVSLGYKRKDVELVLDPVLKIFLDARETKKDISFCENANSPSSYRELPELAETEVTALYDKFGLGAVEFLKDTKDRGFAGWVNPESRALVIFWPDWHHSLANNLGYIELVQQMDRATGKSANVYYANESSSGFKKKCSDLKEDEKECDKALQEYNNMLEMIIGGSDLSGPEGRKSAFLSLVKNEDLFNGFLNKACTLYGICNPELVYSNSFVGSMAGKIIARIAPATDNRTWNVEDHALYKKQVDEVFGNGTLSHETASERSVASAKILLNQVKNNREGRIVVLVSLGALHSYPFLEGLLGNKSVSVVAITPPGFGATMSGNDLLQLSEIENAPAGKDGKVPPSTDNAPLSEQ